MPLSGTSFHKYLYEAFLAQYLELSEIAYKRHYGDYSAVFEQPHEDPLSIARRRQRDQARLFQWSLSTGLGIIVTWAMGSVTLRRPLGNIRPPSSDS